MADKFEVPEIDRLWMAWNNVMIMMRNRKYEIGDDFIMTREKFIEWTGEDLRDVRDTLYYVCGESSIPTERVVAIFWKETLGTADLQSVAESMQTDNIVHAIIVHKNKITPHAAANLRLLKVQDITIETFNEIELQYNIIDHEDVPQHIICSIKTKNKIMTAYAINKEQIPKILITDPVIRHIGAVRGQLIKIVRVSDSIPEIPDITNPGQKKILYDITYKIVS